MSGWEVPELLFKHENVSGSDGGSRIVCESGTVCVFILVD